MIQTLHIICRWDVCNKVAEEKSQLYVSSHNHRDIIAGQVMQQQSTNKNSHILRMSCTDPGALHYKLESDLFVTL